MRSTEQKATGATTGNKQSSEVTEEFRLKTGLYTTSHLRLSQINRELQLKQNLPYQLV